MSDPSGYAKGVKGEIDQRPKRFYTSVELAVGEEGWAITLDGRALRTPGAKRVQIPQEKLAQTIAEEWTAQGERIDLATMYNTRRLYGVLDRSADVRDILIERAVRYVGTDLVCYIADKPAALRERQRATWDPHRIWAATAHGVHLEPVEGILPVDQPPASLAAMRAHASSLDDYRLDGLSAAIALCGSAVLGLAVERGRLNALDALVVSRVDEAFQIEQWGEDDEARQRAKAQRREAAALDGWFAAIAND